MMSKPSLGDQRDFIKHYGFTEDEFNSTGLAWDDMKKIYDLHCDSREELQMTGEHISKLIATIPDVHSIKIRVKNPERLVRKIIHKKIDKPDREFSVANYREQITDLVGVRALHLSKDQWLPIHQYVEQEWGFDLEKPIAYIRRGDSDLLSKQFKKCGCDVQEDPLGYRSVHYLIPFPVRKKTAVAELQVRTLFEEAWSEIDHRLRYENSSINSHVEKFHIFSTV
jgi:putative GTP pyrophosphokinase